MRRLIRVGVIPLLKDISENQPAWYGEGEVILVPMSAARFDLIDQLESRCGHNGLRARRTGRFCQPPSRSKAGGGPARELPSQFRRTLVDYYTKEPAGTIIVDTPNTHLYLTLGNGKALRYGIGVGREGFTWSGSEKVSRMAEWPDWNPPEQMIERQPYLPRFMAGGEGNPLGARALYLGDTLFRIHGTNQPSTIGTFVSSGCIRLTNDDITDLYKRVKVGTRVVVLSANGTRLHNHPVSAEHPHRLLLARIRSPNRQGSARAMRALQNRSRF